MLPRLPPVVRERWVPQSMVTFLCLNLLDTMRQSLIWGVDFIFCRNVLIYFDLDTKRRVAEIFHDKLKPGGHLLLGHAESLLNVTSIYRICHLSHDLVYQKSLPQQQSEGRQALKTPLGVYP